MQLHDLTDLNISQKTAVAAANATINHLRLGRRIREVHRIYDVVDDAFRFFKDVGSTHVAVVGWTDTGIAVSVLSRIVFGDIPGQKNFRAIDRVYTAVKEPTCEDEGMPSSEQPQKFCCRFEGNKVIDVRIMTMPGNPATSAPTGRRGNAQAHP